MADDVHETIDIAASPDAVWRVGGDVGNLGWIPGIEATSMEGDVRRLTLGGGAGQAVERIVSRSDEARTYEYELVEGPMPLRLYRSRLSVEPAGDGSRVHWSAQLEASDPAQQSQLAELVRGSYRGGLAALKQRLEGGGPQA